MSVLFDTARLPAHERVDALQAAFTVESPQRVALLGDARAHHRTESVDLGPDVRLRRDRGCPLLVARDAQHVRMHAPEVIAIALHRRGEAVLSTAGTDRALRAGELDCNDTTRPYRLVQRDVCDVDVLMIGNRQAGVSVDVVRAARPVLARSPVYELVRGHLAGLFDATVALPPQPRSLTGQATAALVRTLLLTAAGGDGERAALHDTLELRIDAHIEAHLGDPDLAVERIAAVHNISVRQLYNVWARTGRDQPPARWIITRRLERARELLVAPEAAGRGVASVARQCGFADASHFSRRFREAFGVAPRDWRAAGQPGGDHHAVTTR